jgi:hypothetical protein
MSAKHKRMHVFDADFTLHRYEAAHARGVQHASHAENAVFRETTEFQCGLGHSIQRIGHYDDDAVRRMLHDLLDDVFHYVVVSFQQVVAAHPWFAREARGDHHNVATRRRGIIAGCRTNAYRVRIRPRNRPGFHHVQCLACRRPVQNIRQHHIGQFQIHDALRRGRSHETATHNSYFLPAHAPPRL